MCLSNFHIIIAVPKLCMYQRISYFMSIVNHPLSIRIVPFALPPSRLCMFNFTIYAFSCSYLPILIDFIWIQQIMRGYYHKVYGMMPEGHNSISCNSVVWSLYHCMNDPLCITLSSCLNFLVQKALRQTLIASILSV